MKDIGLIGWCVISFLLIMIIGFNLWLYEFFKSKGNIPEIQILKRSFHTLQKPFGQEEEQISELSRKVREITAPHSREE